MKKLVTYILLDCDMTLVEVSEKATATSPSLEKGSCPHLVRLQSKESKVEETRNREDGKKRIAKR